MYVRTMWCLNHPFRACIGEKKEKHYMQSVGIMSFTFQKCIGWTWWWVSTATHFWPKNMIRKSSKIPWLINHPPWPPHKIHRTCLYLGTHLTCWVPRPKSSWNSAAHKSRSPTWAEAILAEWWWINIGAISWNIFKQTHLAVSFFQEDVAPKVI